MTHHFPDFGFGIFAMIGAGVTAIFKTLAVSTESLPAWVGELGLPVAFLLGVSYALVKIHNCYRESEKARIADKEQYVKEIKELHEKTVHTLSKVELSLERMNDKLE